jgi:formate dehydrogenase iron-sulfur subunit
VKVFVPRDAAALAVGAEAVASALTGIAGIELIRNGSRGLLWLEPMVEVETLSGRIAYGPVQAADVPGLLAAGMLDGGAHRLRLGRPEEIPFLARQTRLTFERCGIVDPLSLDDYAGHGGLRGLRRALDMSAAEIIFAVTESGLRGRGGAGFPAGVKWRTVADAPGAEKYIVCNADEGDSGTFADRMLLEGDPFVLIEGMAIAAIAVGARHGYVYIRSEYPHAIATFTRALAMARANRLLGPSILGTGPAFDIEIRVGAGAYICGEETAMLESIEGKRGMVRAKPPLPAHVGLFGQPTIINNLLTLASVPIILDRGAAFYRDFGVGKSRGTMPIQLAGNVLRGGLFETGFGITLGELVDDIGGGTATGRPVRAVQVGGPLGAYFPPTLFDTPFDYEAFAAQDGLIGHGGIVVFDDSVDLADQARFAMAFCAVESCGKCTPCRIGSTRGVEVIDRIIAGDRVDQNTLLLNDLCETMKLGSLCALGGLTHNPVLSALKYFPEDFSKSTRLAAE